MLEYCTQWQVNYSWFTIYMSVLPPLYHSKNYIVKITILLFSTVAWNSTNLVYHRECYGYMHVCYYDIMFTNYWKVVIKLCVCGFTNPFDGQIQLHVL